MLLELAVFYAISAPLALGVLVVLRMTHPRFEVLILDFDDAPEVVLPLAA